LRLFVAINLPHAEVQRLGSAIETLARHDLSVRWGEPDTLHITLKFLGAVEDSQLPAVQRALEEAVMGTAPFDVELAGLGAFPSLARPNIVWIGVSGGDELMALQRRSEEAVAALGFEREPRAYKPHITLGRVRKDGRIPDRKLMDRIVKEFDHTARFRVEAVDLMRSRLSPRGARYEVVERMELF
jgi:2'-5' RNA ligase